MCTCSDLCYSFSVDMNNTIFDWLNKHHIYGILKDNHVSLGPSVPLLVCYLPQLSLSCLQLILRVLVVQHIGYSRVASCIDTCRAAKETLLGFPIFPHAHQLTPSTLALSLFSFGAVSALVWVWAWIPIGIPIGIGTGTPSSIGVGIGIGIGMHSDQFLPWMSSCSSSCFYRQLLVRLFRIWVWVWVWVRVRVLVRVRLVWCLFCKLMW